MPSTMIHLLTGLAFTSTCNLINNKSQFFLGCIAPDAVNVYSFAPKEMRTKAHLRSPNLDEWAQNAIDFYVSRQNKIDNDLLIGYVLHAFCDMAWDKKYESAFVSRLKELKLSDEQIKAARWNEFYCFDKTQFTSNWWLHDVRPFLEKAIAYEINGIDTKQIDDFSHFVLEQYEQSINSNAYGIITPDMVNEFIYYAAAMLKNEL